MNIQLFGADCPPLYGEETTTEIIEDIAKIDVEINALFIKREECVTALKKKLEKKD